MTRIKLLLVFFLCSCLHTLHAQENSYFISPPADLKQTGCNKVLCMKNGNTVLLHFETGKRITVVVYDSTHKLIAHQEHLCRILDVYILKDVMFKGLYEVNGEAVLFMEQEHLSRKGLIRLRFNATTADLADEKLLAESESITRRTYFYVMKNKQEESYAILYAMDNAPFKECKINVVIYDKHHEQLKNIPLDVDRKKYDYLTVIGAESKPNGICVSLGLSSVNTNSSSGSAMGYGVAAIYDHYLAVYYIGADSTRAHKNTVDVSTDIFPFYTNYTYNPFSKTLNVLMVSYKEYLYKYGLSWLPAAMHYDVFFKVDEGSMAMDHNFIKNRMANSYLQRQTDSTHGFDGLPVTVFTNDNGLSTMISESFTRYTEPQNNSRTNYDSYLGNIGITQFDDDGNEIWGTVLPKMQYYNSNTRYYHAALLAKKWQEQYLFSDQPDQVYNRQFISLNAYTRNKNFYIVYNDNDKNFNNSLAKPGDTVTDMRMANACYYAMNRKKEISRHYLFGQPAADTYITSFIEGADFDEQRGVYATLVQYAQGRDVTLRMAWSHLD